MHWAARKLVFTAKVPCDELKEMMRGYAQLPLCGALEHGAVLCCAVVCGGVCVCVAVCGCVCDCGCVCVCVCVCVFVCATLMKQAMCVVLMTWAVRGSRNMKSCLRCRIGVRREVCFASATLTLFPPRKGGKGGGGARTLAW